MKKIIARYFYAPICPESFASLDRLHHLFYKYKDQIHFEAFNVFDCAFKLRQDWFSREIELIKSIEEGGTYPLLFGLLFIQGKEIKGFPPSKQFMINTLKEYGVLLKEEDYQLNYVQINKTRLQCDMNKFEIKRYEKRTFMDTCIICTKHNPYLDEKTYAPKNWVKYEQSKAIFLEKCLDNDRLIGFIEYYNEEPIGFIEAFPLDMAQRLGFPVSTNDKNGAMITCLSVRSEMSGYGVASRLIGSLEREAREKKYRSIEVLSFPDERNWQPESLYAKIGYEKAKEINNLCIMKKNL